MTLVGLASKNPLKLAAALTGFQRMFAGGVFEVCAFSVASAVAHQPRSDGETLRGATERAQQARAVLPEFLTGNVLDRTQLYADAVILALVPFKNRELYGPA